MELSIVLVIPLNNCVLLGIINCIGDPSIGPCLGCFHICVCPYCYMTRVIKTKLYKYCSDVCYYKVNTNLHLLYIFKNWPFWRRSLRNCLYTETNENNNHIRPIEGFPATSWWSLKPKNINHVNQIYIYYLSIWLASA